MNKDTIELERLTDFTFGYGRFMPKETTESLLDTLIEWSRKEENKDRKIYRHLVRETDENIGETMTKQGQTFSTASCDRVVYLDIYWQ